jgi:hypothetical protein
VRFRHGMGAVSSEYGSPSDVAAVPEKATSVEHDGQTAGVIRPAPAAQAANEGLSQELEALLDLVRHSPQPSQMQARAPSASDLAAHDRMLQALLLQAPVAGPTAAGLEYSNSEDVHARMPVPVRSSTAFPPPSMVPAEPPAGDRLPAAWYSPDVAAPEPWFGSELRAGALGLGLGVLIIVPAVLLSRGWLMTERAAPQAPRSAVAQQSEPARPLIAAIAEPKIELATVRREPVAPPAAVVDPAVVAQGIVAQARQLIETGDVHAARSMLSDAGLSGRADAQFVLAETFDPNVLAAWGTRGINADVEKARAHYQVALGLGQQQARERIKGLE